MKIRLTVLTLLIGFSNGQTAVDSTGQDRPALALPIAVLTLEGRGVSAQEADILTERLRSNLVQNGRYQVVERSQMEAILKEQGFQQSGCSTNECLVQAGMILGVEQMVGGTVGRIGTSYTMDVRLFDVESAQILKAVSRDYSGPIDGLLEITAEITRELAGDHTPSPLSPRRTDHMMMLSDETVEQGLDVLKNILTSVGEAIDTTAHSVAKKLQPKPRDPDIKAGRDQGRLDAQDYQRRFIWFLPTFAASTGMLYSYENETDEDQITAGILAGLAAKIIVELVVGDPRLPDHLVRKISSQSTVYQDNYRQSWLKEVKKIRSNRADSGCLLGLAVGYAALHY